MRKIFVLFFLYIAAQFSLQSQDFFQDDVNGDIKKKPKISKRFFTGGNMGFGISNTESYIELSPILGYKVTKSFSAGIGVTYIYSKQKSYYSYGGIPYEFAYKSSVYGGRVFVMQNIISNLSEYIQIGIEKIFIYSEMEYLSYRPYEIKSNIPAQLDKRVWIPGLYVGGGISQRLADRFAINIIVLWNVLQSDDFYQNNPVLRIGFQF